MMYLVELEREIELQPCFFGPRLREVLEQKLHSEVNAHPPDFRSPHVAFLQLGMSTVNWMIIAHVSLSRSRADAQGSMAFWCA